MNQVIIFDCDGTLSDCSHRLHLIQPNDHKDWDLFFENSKLDGLIDHIAHFYRMCSLMGPVDIITGRPERLRDITMQWLADMHLPSPRALHMGTDGDRRPDSEVKLEIYDRIYKGKEEVIAVFEDRSRVVKAWRSIGVPCYQVAEGDY